MFYLCFFEKSIIINIERNRCFVLQTKNSVKQINRERERERDKSKIWGGGWGHGISCWNSRGQLKKKCNFHGWSKFFTKFYRISKSKALFCPCFPKVTFRGNQEKIMLNFHETLRQKTGNSIWYGQFLEVPVTVFSQATSVPKLEFQKAVSVTMIVSSEKMKMKKSHPILFSFTEFIKKIFSLHNFLETLSSLLKKEVREGRKRMYFYLKIYVILFNTFCVFLLENAGVFWMFLMFSISLIFYKDVYKVGSYLVLLTDAKSFFAGTVLLFFPLVV